MISYECPDCGWDMSDINDDICYCDMCKKGVDKIDAIKKNYKTD